MTSEQFCLKPVNGIVQPPYLPPHHKKGRVTNQLQFMEVVLKTLMKHPHAWPFEHPVDAIKLCIPDYHKIIRCPMDLTTIKRRLKNRWYHSATECIEDIKLVFYNCHVYNKPHQDVAKMAVLLEKAYMKKMRNMPQPEIELTVKDTKIMNQGNVKKGGRPKGTGHIVKRKSSSEISPDSSVSTPKSELVSESDSISTESDTNSPSTGDKEDEQKTPSPMRKFDVPKHANSDRPTSESDVSSYESSSSREQSPSDSPCIDVHPNEQKMSHPMKESDGLNERTSDNPTSESEVSSDESGSSDEHSGSDSPCTDEKANEDKPSHPIKVSDDIEKDISDWEWIVVSLVGLKLTVKRVKRVPPKPKRKRKSGESPVTNKKMRREKSNKWNVAKEGNLHPLTAVTATTEPADKTTVELQHVIHNKSGKTTTRFMKENKNEEAPVIVDIVSSVINSSSYVCVEHSVVSNTDSSRSNPALGESQRPSNAHILREKTFDRQRKEDSRKCFKDNYMMKKGFRSAIERRCEEDQGQLLSIKPQKREEELTPLGFPQTDPLGLSSEVLPEESENSSRAVISPRREAERRAEQLGRRKLMEEMQRDYFIPERQKYPEEKLIDFSVAKQLEFLEWLFEEPDRLV